MLLSRPSLLDVFALIAYQEHSQCPECQARGVLLSAMIAEDKYGGLFVRGWGLYVQKEARWSDRNMVAQFRDNLRAHRPPAGPARLGTVLPQGTKLLDLVPPGAAPRGRGDPRNPGPCAAGALP